MTKKKQKENADYDSEVETASTGIAITFPRLDDFYKEFAGWDPSSTTC